MYKILVVDNQPDVRKTLCGLLNDAGHTAQPAANEGEALAAIMRESFDFALIDVRLHEEDETDESGLSLAIAFRTLKPQIRVILLTKYVRTAQIVRAIRYHGVVDFIEKTPDMDKLILKTIAEAGDKTEQPRFKTAEDATRFSLLLAPDQPPVIRAYGKHVCSTRASKKLQLDIARYATKLEIARKNPDDLRFLVDAIGRELWHEIFAENPEVSVAYVAARAQSRPLSLVFDAPREFLRLPFELMREISKIDNPLEYLVLQHPLARFVSDAIPKCKAISPQLLALSGTLRVLIIASNTQPPIQGVDSETRRLHDYLKQQDCIPVDATLIPTELATYDRVREELGECNYDIIHYAGHGLFTPDSPEDSSLYFWSSENKQGPVVPMKAAELKILLEQSEVRLVYLSSCYGTATGDQATLLRNDFLGLADAVAQAGVPSVIGFRWPVLDTSAPKFAFAFYRSLLEQGSPEIALWRARREIAALNRNDPTWLSPILIHQE